MSILDTPIIMANDSTKLDHISSILRQNAASTLCGLAAAATIATESMVGFGSTVYRIKGHRDQLPPYVSVLGDYSEDVPVHRGGMKSSKRSRKLQKLARRNNR